ncbi:MAG: hypothetical protein HY903_04950 [Deltaproteobacteria bacterium]|nr:hypothetical protein [Deltaproteobacteria bacterium]
MASLHRAAFLLGVAAPAAVLVGCPRLQVARDGRPCEAGRCIAGFVCDPLENVCVASDASDLGPGPVSDLDPTDPVTPTDPPGGDGCVSDCGGRCAGPNGCGGECVDACVSPESCGGGGVFGVCGWWWSCAYGHRRKITIAAGADRVAAGHSLRVAVNHGAWVTRGVSVQSGDDLRVVRFAAPLWAETDRVADPTTPMNRAAGATWIWFAAGDAIAAGGTDESFYLYYGAPTAGMPPADEARIFAFADFFGRADATDVDRGWYAFDTATGYEGKVGIVDHALAFTMTGDSLYNRPVVDHDFATASGKLEWRFGFDWTRPPADALYAFNMQLGSASLMDNPPGALIDSAYTRGVGVSLEWGGSDSLSYVERLWCEAGGMLSPAAGVALAGLSDVAVAMDVGSATYDVSLDGVLVLQSMPFSTAVTSLSRMRFLSWTFAADSAAHRAVRYVMLRRRLAAEPTVTLGGEEQHSCP